MRENVPTYPESEVPLRDQLSASASVINGVADALTFRADAEDDDMLHLLAEALYTEVAHLKQLPNNGLAT